MKLIFNLLFLLISTFAIGQNSSIEQLAKQLKEAESSKEKMLLNYQLADAYLRVDAKKTIEYGKKAHSLANSKKDNGMSARSAYIVAKGYARKRNNKNAEVWYKSTLKFAKTAGYSDLIIKSVDARSKLAVKDRNYRKAYQITEEAFTYFSKNGKSMSDLDSKYDAQKSKFEKEKRELQKEKDELNFQINNLRLEGDQLSTDKTVLEERQAQLEKSNADKQSEITAKQDEIAAKQDEILTIEEEKKAIEASAKKKVKKYKNLSKETIIEKAALKEAKLEAEKATQESKLIVQQSENVRNLSFAAAGILFLLMMVFYMRFRSKRKAANNLAESNKIIEAEKERSEELLLNILPKNIAKELKEFGKAKAQKYTETTVLFTDFKNFTLISEQLTPEELVEELDYCFKSFDFILSQYDEVEKIKTIGDAYMCASGLTEKRTIPYGIIRAAIEIQAFLEERKQERMRLGKPFFEARIGLHTGAVVAGVVGVDKFAYDIWGDTVNIAARMESKSLPGKINISESTFNLVRYKFDCEYRGKVEAKNKGQIDMYFVKGELQTA